MPHGRFRSGRDGWLPHPHRPHRLLPVTRCGRPGIEFIGRGSGGRPVPIQAANTAARMFAPSGA